MKISGEITVEISTIKGICNVKACLNPQRQILISKILHCVTQFHNHNLQGVGYSKY